LLASSLMVTRGALLYCAVRFGNAESSALTATGSTPSNSKDTTQAKTYKTPLDLSLSDIGSRYDSPHAAVNDVVHGRLGANEVMLDEWIQLTAMAMIEAQQPHLNIHIPYGGGLYEFHHCITVIKPPAPVQAIMETEQ